MKRYKSIAAVIVLALLTLSLAACAKSEFKVSENTEKKMTITAENAEKDAFVMFGTLELAEGEKAVLSSSLSKGSVRIELIASPEDQSIEEVPEMDEEEAVMSADLSAEDESSGTPAAGSYMIRATCLEKATGTVVIEAKPAE